MTTNTVRLHRVLRTTPERLYRAFVDADALAKWLPPNGFTGKVHEMDARVNGRYTMSFTNFSSGHTHGFTTTFLEMKPGERLAYVAVFDDPGLPGEIKTTVTLMKVSCGTALHVTQEGIPNVIPVDGCMLGWQESLAQLALLVEPDIPG
ncbi:SRPBCC family protein [Piscinibacter gummiphilus]|uniref:SRPBCC family protein n=1 Tax=Piscinibacter gummiphilus TaxID=946333 RepID=A0ABZ0D8N9_9BURK|nr:SRPBCC family protein [Piscinibacter gummiphilus]WOB11054.1 SRPBCC family protein [Piscinibacter gummiphilus]